MKSPRDSIWFGVVIGMVVGVGCETTGGSEPAESDEVVGSVPDETTSPTDDGGSDLPPGFSVEEREPGREVAFEFAVPPAGRWRWQSEIREEFGDRRRRVVYQYDREVARFGAGRSIARRRPAVLEVEAETEERARAAVDWYRAWLAGRPPYAVDSYGRIVRLVDEDESEGLPRRAMRRRRLDGWGGGEEGEAPGGGTAEEARRSHYSPESRVRSDWYWTTRFWEGRRGEVGASYRTTVDAPYPSPLLGRVRVSTRVEFEVEGTAPCRNGEGRCVVASAQLTPNADQIERALRQYVSHATAHRPSNVDVHLADAGARLVLLLDPDGLRHWRRHWVSRDRFDIDVGGGVRQLRATWRERARVVEQLSETSGTRPDALERGD